jgi:hypothetical protein
MKTIGLIQGEGEEAFPQIEQLKSSTSLLLS